MARYLLQLTLAATALGAIPPAPAAVFNFSADFINGGAPSSAPFSLWLPDDPSGPPGTTAPVKGLIFLLPGAGEDWRGQVQKPNFQAAASALGFGLVGANSMLWGQITGETAGVVTGVLDAAAAAAGRPELANAPFAAMGVSQGGYNSTRIALAQPDRAIAFVNIRGGYSFNGGRPESDSLDIPGLSIVGSQDSVVHPGLAYEGWAYWRGIGAPHAYAVEWDTTHFDTRRGQSWEVGWHWIGEAVRRRYGNAPPLSTTPGVLPELDDVDATRAWVGLAPVISPADDLDSLVPSDSVEIAPITGGAFSEPLLQASWLPGQTAARIYQSFTSFDGLSRPITPRQGPLHFIAPLPISDVTTFETPLFEVGGKTRIETEVHAYDTFINGIVLTEVDYYLDEHFLGTVAGENNWQLEVTFAEPGIHALLAVGRDAAGNTYPAFRTVLIAPQVPEPAAANLMIGLLVGAARCSRRGCTRRH